MKLDMHVHTKYSKDSLLSLQTLAKKCGKLGITSIITDHNEIKGNILHKCPITASEISSSDGHVIGYFINEKIKQNLSAIETIELIHSQGGLACVPHPFDMRRSNSVNNQDIIRKADLIEGFNSRVVNQAYNILAMDFAKKHGKPITIGTDSHTRFELGKSYIEMEEFDSPKEFVKNLMKAEHIKMPNMRIYSIWTYIFYNGIGRLR